MALHSDRGQFAGTSWNPSLYLKFADYRSRPARELLARVQVVSPKIIYDLGCGPGKESRLLAEQWPAATVYGVDNSPEMLKKAAAEPSRVQWIEADINTWRPPEAADLIYSNATLQWVSGHNELMPRLVGYLRPGGSLAVQMPLSWDSPSHRLMSETLANGGPSDGALGPEALRHAIAYRWVENASYYYDLLADHTTHLDIWETEYLHVFEGEDPILEWVKGTGLRPILNVLDEAERELFLEKYARSLRAAYPMRANGRTLYPFRRLFIIATV